jgi:hypothetical protein
MTVMGCGLNRSMQHPTLETGRAKSYPLFVVNRNCLSALRYQRIDAEKKATNIADKPIRPVYKDGGSSRTMVSRKIACPAPRANTRSWLIRQPLTNLVLEHLPSIPLATSNRSRLPDHRGIKLIPIIASPITPVAEGS